VLSTYDAMAEARRIYQRAGFQLDQVRPVHEFGADLVDEAWSLDLVS
jgi:hypothetical protein